MENIYWYELIHRPAGTDTVPAGFVSLDNNHKNRNGFTFGKVAYNSPLSSAERHTYSMEPVHVAGMTEISLITKEVLAANRIKLTPDMLQHLIESSIIEPTHFGAWQYLDLSVLKDYADANLTELKKIYKFLKKSA